MTRRRDAEGWFRVSRGIHRDPKVAGLSSHADRWAFVVLLAEGKVTAGSWSSRAHLEACLPGGLGDSVPALIEAGLIALAPDGSIAVPAWETWQDDAPRDRTKRTRDAAYRARNAEKLAEGARLRRQAERQPLARSVAATGDVTADVTPLSPSLSPSPDPTPTPTHTPVRLSDSHESAPSEARGASADLPLAARYKQLIERVASSPDPAKVARVIDGYRAIYGREATGQAGQLAALVRDHQYGAVGVMRDLAAAATRDVGKPIEYVAGIIRSSKRRPGATAGRVATVARESQDSSQYANLGRVRDDV